jgi:carbon starvation protein
MHRIVFNDYLDAGLAGFFMLVVLSVLFFGVRTVLAARRLDAPSTQESPFVAAPALQS